MEICIRRLYVVRANLVEVTGQIQYPELNMELWREKLRTKKTTSMITVETHLKIIIDSTAGPYRFLPN